MPLRTETCASVLTAYGTSGDGVGWGGGVRPGLGGGVGCVVGVGIGTGGVGRGLTVGSRVTVGMGVGPGTAVGRGVAVGAEPGGREVAGDPPPAGMKVPDGLDGAEDPTGVGIAADGEAVERPPNPLIGPSGTSLKGRTATGGRPLSSATTPAMPTRSNPAATTPARAGREPASRPTRGAISSRALARSASPMGARVGSPRA